MLKKLLIALASLATTAVLFAAPASAAHEGQMRRVYTADLDPLNAPGGGEARIEVFDQNNTLVTVEADGLSPDAPHAQHIHGATDLISECPTVAADDADGDGFVSVAEGAPKYGGIQVSLTTEGDVSADSGLAVERFPVAEDGAYTYERGPVRIPQDVATALANKVIVLHGADLDDSGAYDGDKRSSIAPDLPFEVTVPTACGQVTQAEILLPSPYAATTGVEAKVTRWYAALLNRAPDEAGFAYWVDTYRRVGAEPVVAAFAASPEFQSRFGDVLDAPAPELVEFTYLATFGRSADAGGQSYWSQKVQSGEVGREQLVALFADSPEFQALTGTA